MNDEFTFIRLIMPKARYQRSLIQGIGDDAALFENDERYESVVSIDTLVEGIHFKKSTMTAFDVGYKALAVNLSDLAAMGATPLYYLVSIAIPKFGWNEADLKEVYKGMNKLAVAHQVDLIGGDTVSTKDNLVITITTIGQVEKKRHLLRSHAQTGDVVFVTGTLGGSAAGLSLLLENGQEYPYCEKEKILVNVHQQPKPQVQAGRLLAELKCRVALNDISDGIASEAQEIAEASGKTLVLNYDNIPKHPALQLFSEDQVEQFVLFGGEDFQLLGTVSKSDWEHVKASFAQANIPITQIGYVKDGDVNVLMMKNGELEKLNRRGYNHFSNDE